MDWPPQSPSPTMSGQHQSPMFYMQQAPPTPSPISAYPQALRNAPLYLSRGYVSHMFGPSASRTFWASVLKVLPENIQPQANNTSSFWSIASHDLSAGPQNAGRLLDYNIGAEYVNGPVVPQRLWQPLYRRIREVLVDNSRLCMPIFFVMQDSGQVGLSLADALAKKHYLLLGHNHPVDLGGKVTTHIRILWRGYSEYKRQIQIQDQTRDRNPITLGRLVEHVSEDEYDVQWRVGPDGVKVEDVVLVGVLHTSAGTWQPILRLNRKLPNPPPQPLAPSVVAQTRYPTPIQHPSSASQASSPEQFGLPGTPSSQYTRAYPSTTQLQPGYGENYSSSQLYSAFPYT
ncbi:hypothetical protein K488DRAFT_69115 [Vararia minispora EC-137]|uniref:Uncharacterized protein n=1 Tax=Vararia minispora EC-137 TaxID=1314806 RepID=A0ACB8QRX4_9AGAM|nr:hypothetical protein K488DRAFT_69115 [Vararia minispora EC-137]